MYQTTQLNFLIVVTAMKKKEQGNGDEGFSDGRSSGEVTSE